MKRSFNIDWPAWKAPLRRLSDIARRHWRVFAVPAGVLSLLMAVLALVPINVLRRASLRRDVREATGLFEDNEPFAAFDLLAPIDESRLRFDPSRKPPNRPQTPSITKRNPESRPPPGRRRPPARSQASRLPAMERTGSRRTGLLRMEFRTPQRKTGPASTNRRKRPWSA